MNNSPELFNGVAQHDEITQAIAKKEWEAYCKDMIQKFENAHTDKPEKNTPEEKHAGLSRREFLKQAGGALIWSTFPFAALFSETPRAWSKEVKEGDSWLEGIEALRDEAIYSDRESLALYIIDNHETGRWKNFSKGSARAVSLSSVTIREALAKNPQELKIAHTHLLNEFTEFEMSTDDIEAARNGNAIKPMRPPTTSDISAAIKIQYKNEEKKTRIAQIVVDPKGVWEFSADLQHDFVEKIIAIDRLIDKTVFSLLEHSPIAQRAWQENQSLKTTEDLIVYLKSYKMKKLDQKAQDAISEVFRVLKLFSDAYEQIIQDLHVNIDALTVQSVTQEKLDIAALIENYKKIGFIVSFKTFDELR